MKKILIIEDDTNLQSVYQTVLTQEGFDVQVAGNGQEGLSAVKLGTPSLIILDLMLPGGMNGFDVLEHLKRFPDTSSIPVLVMTNLDSEEQVAKSIGANGFFVKVNTPVAELVRKVKEMVPA